MERYSSIGPTDSVAIGRLFRYFIPEGGWWPALAMYVSIYTACATGPASSAHNVALVMWGRRDLFFFSSFQQTPPSARPDNQPTIFIHLTGDGTRRYYIPVQQSTHSLDFRSDF